MKKYFSASNIISYALFAALLIVIINPQAKALLIRGLLKIGIMQAPAHTEVITRQPLALQLKQGDGELLDAASLRGKVVVINFWATWCPPCIAEMPSVNELYLHYKSNPNIKVLAVDVDADFAKAQGFMDENKYALPVYAQASRIADTLFSGSIPTTLILDKQGRVVARHVGAANYADIDFYAYLDKLAK